MPSDNEAEETGKTPVAVSYQVKENGKVVTGKSFTTNGNFTIEIDGVKTDKPLEEVTKALNPIDIESITVDKHNPEKPVIVIKTKKSE